MATSVENFRSALHGFHRADVVQFIQEQTMQHEKELHLLKEENARLQESISAASAEAEALRAEKEALDAELREAKAALEAELLRAAESAAQGEEKASPDAPPAALDAPLAPVAADAAPAQSDFNEMELAAYRRAEMTERMARERAAASTEQMRSIFGQATEKLNLSSQDLSTLLGAFQNDFDKLRQILAETQETVSESSASLRAASDICVSI